MNKVGVLGIGKLGVCFALNLESTGYEVLGIDIVPEYVEAINNKSLQSPEPQVSEMLKRSTHLRASTQIEDLLAFNAKLIFIMVATPSLADGSYDHSQVERVTDKLIALGKASETKHLVIGCTTMPGYCDTLAEKMAPYNYTVSYNPEFIAQGSIIQDQQQPDQVLIGEANMEAGDAIEAVFRKLCQNEPTFCRMSRLSAEICKIATNCFLTTKISFANSIGDLATKAGAEPDKILAAIGSDSRIGGKYLNYGFGFGGPCFPRDNRALGKFAREAGYELLISDATDEVNKRHLDFQFHQYMHDYAADQTIVFEHVTYKKGTVMLEESQQLALAVRLAHAGRKVEIHELPEVITELKASYADLFSYRERKAD